MVRVALLVGLVVAAGLAGCAGDGPPDAPEGGVDGSASASDPSVGAAVEAVNVSTTVQPFDWEGSVGTVAYACGPAGCQGTGLPMGWEPSYEVEGIVAFDVELTFDALPGQELAFGLATHCDGPCEFVTYGSGSGSIPLSADGLDPERTYTLVAWHPYESAGAGGAQTGVETAFRVTGELTTVA